MIKVVLTPEARGWGGPLRFEDATGWELSDDGTVLIMRGEKVLAEVMVQRVLFVEREESEEETLDIEECEKCEETSYP